VCMREEKTPPPEFCPGGQRSIPQGRFGVIRGPASSLRFSASAGTIPGLIHFNTDGGRQAPIRRRFKPSGALGACMTQENTMRPQLVSRLVMLLFNGPLFSLFEKGDESPVDASHWHKA